MEVILKNIVIAIIPEWKVLSLGLQLLKLACHVDIFLIEIHRCVTSNSCFCYYFNTVRLISMVYSLFMWNYVYRVLVPSLNSELSNL